MSVVNRCVLTLTILVHWSCKKLSSSFYFLFYPRNNQHVRDIIFSETTSLVIIYFPMSTTKLILWTQSSSKMVFPISKYWKMHFWDLLFQIKPLSERIYTHRNHDQESHSFDFVSPPLNMRQNIKDIRIDKECLVYMKILFTKHNHIEYFMEYFR